ncbi:aldo/keto reductase [Brucella sp. NBRC 12950]|uniref:aldo/keto reductase n=1 Tax=Brucella sp. NBRC 12950 TaxID=2994518 RepID=UPI0024A35DF6|nr:aldo/keto reductase [Brucella sp. NBRC 12950]GLU29835.1 oxidoreductase [Brucella sp. NBRC 12950]
MRADARVRFGRSGLSVTRMGFGAAPIGNFLKPVSNEEADAMVSEAWRAGLRIFDTAPLYGHGLSEHRCGHSLFSYPRDEFVLSTKVGYRLRSAGTRQVVSGSWIDAGRFERYYDYSYDGTMRSIEDSLNRLLTPYIDVALIHDADEYNHGPDGAKVRFCEAMNGAYKALAKLREEGVVKAIGFGVNEWQVCHKALEQGDFDCFLLAGRYTLLEQEALDAFLPLCEARDASIILGGGYNSGILATGAVAGAKYNYAPAPTEIMQRVARIETLCQQYNVPLAAAALQFPLAHPAVATIVPGTRNVAQLKQNLDLINYVIPAGFWNDLKAHGLIRTDAPVPQEAVAV